MPRTRRPSKMLKSPLECCVVTEIVFSYPPNRRFESPLGGFSTNDGVLTVRNPDL